MLLQEQLGEARAAVERLQMAAAESEARALHLEETSGEMRSRLEAVEGELVSEGSVPTSSAARSKAFRRS